jgi:hypothetical protein
MPYFEGAPLRNYIFTVGIQYHYDANGNSGDLFAMGSNNVDLKTEIDQTNASIITAFDPTPVTFTYPNEAVTVYWTLDKQNFMRFLRFQTGIDAIRVDALVNNPPLWASLRAPAKTPRKTGWTDRDGVKRKPPPSEDGKESDFSGAEGLVEALNGLLRLAADFTAMKEVRKSEIVLYAYNQVIKGTWAITQAIQYLIDNRITATV